jgi:hypothetical protein
MPKNLRILHLMLLCACALPFLQAQTPSKEYIRLGGRVIAIENSAGSSGGALTVTPGTPTLAAGPNQIQAFNVTPAVSATWSSSPPGVGNINSSGSYTAPICIASQQSVQVTASSPGYQNGPATITLIVPSALPLSAMTFSSGVTQCTATSSITTTTNSAVTINGNANVTFQAGTIFLEPGFTAISSGGATFDAKTQ